ncbi:hydroxymethylpyrimidine/phosphomethylpyrimidine kinase [Sphingobacterium mizutaii NBRC 14946 = DSM 11724]|uniref:hydroxymethylpyrimidine kinase n=2 Tax=Sphingobacterium mizutaii TaxID=1010 RepID=A0AAJ4XDN4_9SPHI|nr:bifunctional hydroxymethylpyrimidine kinase/phosphomethylpyrimidine kinase [Sphingobacterium mizutaii]GEM67641.1 hydroxymethylpyrimidine/phosphomethylpyrimidine kinase [Sphingobacterium mizutaii NBRC 14946 = DSM 11724]SDL15929.1 hydroxymethylpyrimidine/phosphomethylpyrimidine kinase [Sphingobacterium mizutaii]SNV52619.1 Hydroxymethylpyrimidine/phosphomethylpyrimidine kinase [Sphingobacterium mizutaii]
MKENKKYKVPTVLSIAGFDGSGGAGIQADTKTISSLGCYAMNVLTALPVQNTQGVKNIFDIPVEAVKEQLDCLFEDIYPDSIKIGMVHNSKLVQTIADFLKDYKGSIVFDPVMVSTSGHRLIQEETIAAIKELLFPIAQIITPNLDEVSVLVGREISTVHAMEEVADEIQSLGCNAALLKGGHLQSDILTSILIQKNQAVQYFESKRVQTKNTHGSGCSLSSAIASFLARGYHLEQSTENALMYINSAIKGSKDLVIGKGNGPLNHFFNPQRLIKYELD